MCEVLEAWGIGRMRDEERMGKMTTAKWILSGVAGMAGVWCLVLWPWATLATLGGGLVLGVAYLYFIHFRHPRRMTSLDEVSDHRWRTVNLAAETISGDGSSYEIYVRRGASPNLVVHFSGGGACWDDHTAARPITTLSVLRGYTRELKAFYFASLTRLFPAGLTGLANRRDSANGFRDWNIVFIPYTTGDLHIGDAVRIYTGKRGPFEVHHNGRANATAALAWVFENFPDVGKVMVSGESSGAWASAFYAPMVADHFPGKRICCLSDGAGIRSSRWPTIVDQVWKAESAAHLGFEVGPDLYENALTHRSDGRHRDIKYLHSNTLYDDTLTRFDAALNDRPTDTDQFIDEWAGATKESMSRLANSGLRYQFFLTDWGHNTKRRATAHTVTTNELYRRCEADGVAYAEWLRRNVIDDEDLSLGTKLLR